MSEGQIRIRGRETTTTAELGIRHQANGAHQTLSAQEDLQAIAQQQKTVAQATAQIQSAVKTYNENRIAQYEQEKAKIAQILTAQMSPEEQEAFKQKSDSEKKQYYKQHSTTYHQLDQQADSWGTGGTNSRAVNAATTTITGLLGGQNLQQAAMNAGSPYLAETIGNTLSEHSSMPNGWACLLSHGALGALNAKVNGGNATAGALSAAGAELVVSIAVEKLFGDKTLDETGKFNADRLSEDEKKQLSALGAATGAVLGMGVGGNSYNAQVGSVVAQNAVENNELNFSSTDTVNRRPPKPTHEKTAFETLLKSVMPAHMAMVSKDIQERDDLLMIADLRNNVTGPITIFAATAPYAIVAFGKAVALTPQAAQSLTNLCLSNPVGCNNAGIVIAETMAGVSMINVSGNGRAALNVAKKLGKAADNYVLISLVNKPAPAIT